MSTKTASFEKLRSRARTALDKKPSDFARTLVRQACPEAKSPETSHAEQQASRMEAMGQLAGGIAHDFNNLLTVILGHSEFLLKRVESKENFKSRITEIRKAAERGAWLTNQLLAYSRNQLLELAIVRINSIIEDMDGMLRCMLGEDIALDLALGLDLGWTKVDPGKLEQILLNLAGNARDSMPKGGTLRIETFNLSISGNAPRPRPFIVPGEYVALVVKDSGHGMNAETCARIFEPFFTTKETGKGTGLGLATVYGIVKQSGGYIWADSEPGHGSTFQTLLPRVPAPPAPPVVQKELDFRSGGETILLVEDDPGVRMMCAEVLRNAGYLLLVAPSAADGLRLAQNHEGPLDLLLTDVVMPGMTGPQLANRFASRFPNVKVLFMTGYTDDAMENHGLHGKARRVLQKPFTHDALERGVFEALESVRHT